MITLTILLIEFLIEVLYYVIFVPFYYIIARPVDFVAKRTSRVVVYSGLALGFLSSLSFAGYFRNVPFLNRMHLSLAPVSTMLRNITNELDKHAAKGNTELFTGVPETAQNILSVVLFIPMLWVCIFLVFISAYLFHFELMLGITGLVIVYRLRRNGFWRNPVRTEEERPFYTYDTEESDGSWGDPLMAYYDVFRRQSI